MASGNSKGNLNVRVVYSMSSAVLESAKSDEKEGAQSTIGKIGGIRTGLYLRWKSEDVAGFSMKENGGSVLSPKFRVSPLERSNGLINPMESLIFGQTLKLDPNDDLGDRQVVAFHQAQTKIELFRTTYLPFSRADVRRMHVYMSGENKAQIPVGCIEWNTSFGIGNSALIMDCVHNQGFKTTVSSSRGIEVRHKDENGSIAAVISIRGCVNHQITFAADTTEDASWETKVLLLCVMIMAVISRNEDVAVDKMNEDVSEIFAAFLVLFILLGLWIGVYFL